ncbi:hypothetical protein [Euzebya sp.]|uniref:hypothetical protein n=1 Tax=Euzebya sp. TaxID=1971409 RepID=UPI0035143F2B
MDWRRRPGTDPADPHGVADLLARACELVSTSAVEGTRFLFTTGEMLRVSREIEQTSMVSADVPLYVGVQHGHRLDVQRDVYRSLLAAGVEVIAYGCDGGPSLRGISWVRVPEDPYALTASWFLVRGGEAPHALVGFELTGGGERRRWEGFETRDGRLIEAVVDHLAATAEGISLDRAEERSGSHHG